jgi:predicted Zn finger-like uncharacterized protein
VKFLCDRCKTRYSIGDERVRGKILKIRCKNCNNVITVREGMPEIAADEPRRKGQPTQAIEAVSPGAGNNGALGAAFANAMSKPPAALEEEWYVSIEGDQAGPYSLADAQKWVASKPFDADLHCWSEGFDDWLPVDKVSHFRGSRKKPVAVTPPPVAAPPPIPRAATAAPRRPSIEAGSSDTPKPLFAATMASLEAATQPPLGSGNFNLPPPAAVAPPPAVATPVPASMPHAERSWTRATPLGGQPAMPGLHARGTNGRATPVPSNPIDSARIEAPPAVEPKAKLADPLALPKATDPFPTTPKADPFAQTTPQQAKSDPFASGKATPPPALDMTQPVGDFDVDDDLNIGEVSRVVNLADLAKQQTQRVNNAGRATPVPTAANTRTSGSIPLNRTGNVPAVNRTSSPSIPAMNRTGSVASIALPAIGPDGKQVDPTTGEPIPLSPQVAVSHRRGMIALLVGALVLLGGAAAAVIYIVTSREEGSNGGLVGYDVDTTRPDDPRRTGSAGVSPTDTAKPQNPFVPKPKPRPTNPNPNNTNPIPTNPNAKELRPDEIEDMAAKSSGPTQTCWRRSQRGAEAILLADLKKIGVTLTVDKSGVVTNVTLSEHATTSLGKCLSLTIRGWKFRESTAGITARITLVFQGV